MKVLYESTLSQSRDRAFRKELRESLSEISDARLKFVRIPETVGQMEVTVELAAGESARRDILETVWPVIEKFAPLSVDAKCKVQNCSIAQNGTRHRWSLP